MNTVSGRASVAIFTLLLLCALTGCRLVHGSARVAFIGDSITESWAYPTVNYGVHGETTAQMLARFPRLIPGHGYAAVVILGGTNDVLLKVDPEITVRNLERMAQLTTEDHAEPVLCEIPPIFHSFVKGDMHDYRPQVVELNRRIAMLAAAHHWRLTDYFTPLDNHPTYSSDGVHLKRRGYLLMEAALLRQLRAS
jgi:acyl-CoA thioesterase-1